MKDWPYVIHDYDSWQVPQKLSIKDLLFDKKFSSFAVVFSLNLFCKNNVKV